MIVMFRTAYGSKRLPTASRPRGNVLHAFMMGTNPTSFRMCNFHDAFMRLHFHLQCREWITANDSPRPLYRHAFRFRSLARPAHDKKETNQNLLRGAVDRLLNGILDFIRDLVLLLEFDALDNSGVRKFARDAQRLFRLGWQVILAREFGRLGGKPFEGFLNLLDCFCGFPLRLELTHRVVDRCSRLA